MKQDKNIIWLKYLVIPIELVAHPKLNLMDGAVFSIIDALDDPEKGCYARNKYIAGLLLISSSTVNNSIQKLKQHKFIYDNGQKNDDRILKVNPLYKQENEIILKKYQRGGYEELNNPLIKNLRGNKSIYNTLSKDKEGAKRNFAQKGVPSKRTNNLSHKSPSRMAQRTGELNGVGKKAPVKDKSPNPLIEYWNGLPGVRKHKTPNSKIYQQVVGMLRQLRQGTLFTRDIFDPKWLGDKKIGIFALSFTNSEIKQILKSLSLMYQPGYWPEDKGWLKKLNLNDLIYNPRARNSWFLAVAGDPPKLLSKALADHYQGKDPHPRITADVRKFLGKNGDLGDRGMIQLLKGIGQLVEFHEGLPRRSRLFEDGDFAYFCQTPRKFIQHYIDWIELNKLKYRVGSFGTGKMFEMYLDKRWNEDSTPIYKPLRAYLSKD